MACLVPIARALHEAPKEFSSERMSIRELYRSSPGGGFGAMANGLANSAIVDLSPIFALGEGLDIAEVSASMIIPMLGRLALQIGRLLFSKTTSELASLAVADFVSDSALEVVSPDSLCALVGSLPHAAIPTQRIAVISSPNRLISQSPRIMIRVKAFSLCRTVGQVRSIRASAFANVGSLVLRKPS